MELRGYQKAATPAVWQWLARHDGNPLVVMPTGTGKSVVIADFMRQAVEAYPDTRIIMLTHQQELIAQDYAALLRVWPEAPAGVYSAGLNKRDTSAQLLFAGIQSVHKRAVELQWADLIVIDEAHLLSRSETGMYLRLIRDLQAFNRHLRIVGFTATPYRMDSGLLHEGEGALFDDIAYQVPLLKMIQQGYLCEVRSKQADVQLDVSGVHMRGGDFIASELEAAVDVEETTRAAVDEIVRKGEDRGSWLVFCAGVKHADHVAAEIRRWGIACETVMGDTPKPERSRILRDFRAGALRAVTNVGVLTTGFDAPGVDLIALLRPTRSKSLFVQIMGRGMRITEGKDHCLVLDFSDTSVRMGPIDRIDGRLRKGEPADGTFPAKKCPNCNEVVPASTLTCKTCGHEFDMPKPELSRVAVSTPLLSTQERPNWLRVSSVSYARHEKAASSPSMVVTYHTGIVQHREWVHFERTDYPRQKAVEWWQRRMPGRPVPNTVTEALAVADDYPAPAEISVVKEGQYTRVNAVRFG